MFFFMLLLLPNVYQSFASQLHPFSCFAPIVTIVANCSNLLCQCFISHYYSDAGNSHHLQFFPHFNFIWTQKLILPTGIPAGFMMNILGIFIFYWDCLVKLYPGNYQSPWNSIFFLILHYATSVNQNSSFIWKYFSYLSAHLLLTGVSYLP